MSSIMRRRSGLTVLVSLMESSILSEVDDTSILRTGLPSPLRPSSQLATGLSPLAPRSGLERSDFVLCPIAVIASKAVPRVSLMKSGPSGTPSLVGLLVCGYLLMLVLLLQGLVVLAPDLRQIDGRLWEPHV